MKTENQEECEKNEMRLVRESVLITTEALIPNEQTPEFEEKMQDREGFGGKRLSKNIYPKYGISRRSRERKVCIGVWIEDEELEDDVGELLNMFARNQLWCQYAQSVCEQAGGFPRGDEVAKSLRSGRLVRRASIDASEIIRSESDPRSRRAEGIPVRIVNGWHGADPMKMIREERPREDCDRGRLMPNARWDGISANSNGGEGSGVAM